MKPAPSSSPLVAPQVDPAPLNDDWFAPSQRSSLYEAPATPRRGLTFTLVSMALVGFTLGGCLFLWKSESLPRWTGAAPPEVGTTTITNATLGPAPMPAAVAEEPKSTAVDLLPNVPPPPQPAPAARAVAPKVAPAAPRVTPPTPPSELRGVDPSETPASTESPTSVPAATMAPTIDTSPAPSAE